MVDGGRWRVEGGGWRVDGGRWKVEGGGWKVEGGGWRVEGGNCSAMNQLRDKVLRLMAEQFLWLIIFCFKLRLLGVIRSYRELSGVIRSYREK